MNVGSLVAYLNLDDSQYKRALATAGKGLANLGSLGIKAGAGIAAAGSSVQAIAGIAAIASQAAGAVGLLPAAAGAAAFGMQALKVATSGFGDAMSSMEDPAAFAAAIAELSPAAAAAATAVRGLKPAWDAMADSVQERMFAGLADEVTALGTTYMPILGDSFGRVADAANGAGQGVADMLRESARISDVTTLTDRFASVWENLLPAVAPLGGALLDIGVVGAGALNQLTDGATGAAREFGAFIAQARQSGQLALWIQEGVNALSQLGEVVGNVGEILGGVFRAASVDGAGLLGTLVSTTQAIADMVNSVAGQTALSAFFETAASLAGTFMGVLGALLPAVAPLVPLIGQLAQVIGTGLGDVLLAIMPAVGALVEALVGALQPVLPVLAAAFGQIAAVLGPLAATFVDVLAPILPQVAELFMALVEAVLPLLPPIANLVGALLPVVGAILSNVVIPAIRLTIGALAEWWKILATGIQLVADFVNGVVGFFTDLGGNVDRIVGDIRRWISDGFTAAKQFALDAVGQLVSGAVGLFGDLLGNVGRLPGQIMGALGNLGALLINSGRALVDGFLSGIRSAWNAVVSFVQRGMQTLRNLWPFSPAKAGPFSGSGYVTHSGKALTGDFAKSLQAGMPGVIASARQLMDAAHLEMAPNFGNIEMAPDFARPPVTPLDMLVNRRSGAQLIQEGGKTIHIEIHNPTAERSSTAIGDAASTLAALGPW